MYILSVFGGAILAEFTTLFPHRRVLGSTLIDAVRTNLTPFLVCARPHRARWRTIKTPTPPPILCISINQHTWGVSHLTVARASFFFKRV